jgi:hypothetical protein
VDRAGTTSFRCEVYALVSDENERCDVHCATGLRGVHVQHQGRSEGGCLGHLHVVHLSRPSASAEHRDVTGEE